mgnify:FL=1
MNRQSDYFGGLKRRTKFNKSEQIKLVLSGKTEMMTDTLTTIESVTDQTEPEALTHETLETLPDETSVQRVPRVSPKPLLSPSKIFKLVLGLQNKQKQKSPEWIELRKTKIGGSEMPELINQRYKTYTMQVLQKIIQEEVKF